jgi:hypothetical protein
MFLSFDHKCSMGEKSGEYGDNYINFAPFFLMAFSISSLV